MDESVSIETRLREVEDRAEIHDLLSRYSIAIDARDIDTIASLFSVSAEVGFEEDHDYGDSGEDGRAIVKAFYIRRMDVYDFMFHYFHGNTLTFTGPDSASGIVIAHTEGAVNGQGILAGIHYHDDYVRENGKWLFLKRKYDFLYRMPFTELPTRLATVDRAIKR
jgi:hypothetical protein